MMRQIGAKTAGVPGECTVSAQRSTALPWEVPLCGTRLNPHFLFVLPKRKRPFMVKRKDA